MEALVRLANRQVALMPLEESTTATVATTSDVVFRWFIRRVIDVLPDVDRYRLTAYVSEGFNIPLTQLFIDFGTGSILQLSGTAGIKWGQVGAPGDDGRTGRRGCFDLQRLVSGRFLPAHEIAHRPYPHNPELTD